MKIIVVLVAIILGLLMPADADSANAMGLFRRPLAAHITETSKDGKGWQEQGVMTVTYVQAEGQFKSALARDGWAFQHKVSLAGLNSRALYTWKRGGRSVTLMLWRIDVGKTGFSWGVADKGK